MSFLSDFEDQITTTFDGVVTPTAASVVTQFQPAFVAGFSIWILLIAYDVAWGKSEDGMTYLLTKIGKVFLIGTLALWGWPAMQEFAVAIRDNFVVSVTCTTGGICGNTVSSILETNLIDPMATAWANLWDKVADAFSLFDFIGFSWITKAFMILLTVLGYGLLTIAVGIVSVVTLAMYMVAFATFSLLMCVGPFFLMCLAFPVVQRFFESWVGCVITASLAMAFTALLAILTATILGIPDLATDTAAGDLETYALLLKYAGKAGMCLLVLYLYYKTFDLAAALGGGLNLGNNMAAAMRNIARDLMRSPPRPPGGAGPNSIGQGRQSATGPSGGGNTGGGGTGGGGGWNVATPSANRRATLAEKLAARQTFTGMAVAGGMHAVGSVSRFAYNRGVAATRLAADAGTAAYRRARSAP